MKRFKAILCVVTNGTACGAALERAVALAECNQAGLTVIEVTPRMLARIGLLEGGPIFIDDLQEAMVMAHARELEALVEPYRTRIDIQTSVLVGIPYLEIIREVLRNKHDLIIKTPESQAWLDRFFTSDDMHLLRKCPCPVWLTRPEKSKGYHCILAAIDVGDEHPVAELEARQVLNRQIIEMASSLALSDFAELHIVHAWEAIGESVMASASMRVPDEQVMAYVKQVRGQHAVALKQIMHEVTGDLGQEALSYLKPRTHLVKGAAHKEIPALARQIKADLVVMGTVARTGIPGFFMGNTAETILNQIDSSVLAIKPPGFATPVTLDG